MRFRYIALVLLAGCDPGWSYRVNPPLAPSRLGIASLRADSVSRSCLAWG
jgi:hypothetical protein